MVAAISAAVRGDFEAVTVKKRTSDISLERIIIMLKLCCTYLYEMPHILLVCRECAAAFSRLIQPHIECYFSIQNSSQLF